MKEETEKTKEEEKWDPCEDCERHCCCCPPCEYDVRYADLYSEETS